MDEAIATADPLNEAMVFGVGEEFFVVPGGDACLVEGEAKGKVFNSSNQPDNQPDNQPANQG